jgi:hypothetical protein
MEPQHTFFGKVDCYWFVFEFRLATFKRHAFAAQMQDFGEIYSEMAAGAIKASSISSSE